MAMCEAAEFDTVRLSPNQTTIDMNEKTMLTAVNTAYRWTMSPCEWDATPDEYRAMAHYVMWATQRLHGIKQLAGRLDWPSGS